MSSTQLRVTDTLTDFASKKKSIYICLMYTNSITEDGRGKRKYTGSSNAEVVKCYLKEN